MRQLLARFAITGGGVEQMNADLPRHDQDAADSQFSRWIGE
jgi:hypothetical protein